jgi:hypothetical protein
VLLRVFPSITASEGTIVGPLELLDLAIKFLAASAK